MVNTVLTDGKEDAHIRCPRCNPKPLAALLNHPEQATLPSHQQAIKTFQAAETARCEAERQIALKEDASNPISSSPALQVMIILPLPHLRLTLQCRCCCQVQKEEGHMFQMRRKNLMMRRKMLTPIKSR
jgi:hypothetical protein